MGKHHQGAAQLYGGLRPDALQGALQGRRPRWKLYSRVNNQDPVWRPDVCGGTVERCLETALLRTAAAHRRQFAALRLFAARECEARLRGDEASEDRLRCPEPFRSQGRRNHLFLYVPPARRTRCRRQALSPGRAAHHTALGAAANIARLSFIAQKRVLSPTIRAW